MMDVRAAGVKWRLKFSLTIIISCIIPHSEEPKHEQYDMVEVRTQTRKDGRIYRAVGRVRCADPDRPHYVRLYGYKNYRRVLQNFTRQWTLMISNDTQSSSEDSISQSY